MWSIIALGGIGIMKGQKSSELDFKTPMPPESFQFKKRLVNNVSLYTGQPSISIPIYTIDLDGMEIPISISYNSGGVKTDEDATFVGLGWSLDIGGEINRTNHGALDENYLMATSYDAPEQGIGNLKSVNVNSSGFPGYSEQYCSSNLTAQIQNITNFYQRAYDSSDPLAPYESVDARPDDFFYSIPGHSGKIMYSQKTSKFVIIPFDDIKTDYSISNTSYGSYTKKNLDFVFISSDGYKFNFGRGGIKSMYKLMTGGRLFDQTWQVGSITSPVGNTVTYSYLPIEYSLCTNFFPVSTLIKSTNQISTEYMKCNEVSNKDNLPYTILFPEGKIEFMYDNRIDLMPNSKRLTKIIVTDLSGKAIKTIEFNQSYFDANDDPYPYNPNSPDYANIVNKRLKLNSVKIINGSNNSPGSNESYEFDYYLFDKIPAKTTVKRDHWGYFNGGTYSTSTFPKTKQINSQYSQTFSLKSVKYPEGGTKEFIYESHTAIPHSRIRRYYDDITDDGFTIKNESLYVSGYNLLNYYPTPSNLQLSNYPPGHKVILGNEFEIKAPDQSMSPNEVSLNINSSLPFQVPDYQNINSEYNYVAFQIQKKSGNDFEFFRDLGKISKSENMNGIEGKIDINTGTSSSLNTGIYRIIMIVYQPTVNDSNNVNVGHSSSVNLKYRQKISDEVKIGGLRIKQINTYTNGNISSSPNYVTKYSYVQDDNTTSSGKAMNAPSYYEFFKMRSPSSGNGLDYIPAQYTLTTRMSTEPMTPLYKTSGANVGYTKVTKTDVNISNNSEIKESNYFSFQDPYYSEISSYSLSREQEPQSWQRGKLLSTQYFKNNEVVREISFDYNGEAIEHELDEVDEITTDLVDYTEFYCGTEWKTSKHIDLSNTYAADFVQDPNLLIPYNLYNPTGHLSSTYIPYRKIYSGFDKIKSKTIKDFVNGVPTLVTKESFFYYNNIYRQLEKQNTIYPDNTTTEKSFKYAYEKGNQLMIEKNMIGIPLETVSTQTIGNITKTLSRTETIYPTSVPTAETGSLVLPISVLSYDLQNPTTVSTEITYNKYDTQGNLLQYTLKSGIPVAIVWGYNQTQPIAKIEGATYDQLVSSGLISSIVSASDSDASNPANEGALIAALDNFRNNTSLSGYQITTYTYDPLIGVTSITPPSGIREVYVYDTANRLEKIVDVNGKLLKEFKYNYKN